jgi:hypothetical protein
MMNEGTIHLYLNFSPRWRAAASPFPVPNKLLSIAQGNGASTVGPGVS